MIIQSPTSDIMQSIAFYTKLQFTKIENDERQLFTDGKVVVEINEERTARLELKITVDELDVKAVKDHTSIQKINDNYLVVDYSGVWIRVVIGKENETLVKTNQTGSMIGNYGGISIETPDLAHSMKLWQLLGFEAYMGKAEQGWVALKNDKEEIVSLMAPFNCPHLFFNPSLTFFNGKKNPEIIRNIRKQQINIVEEITHFNKEGLVDNIIIQDPGGLGIFVFNDE